MVLTNPWFFRHVCKYGLTAMYANMVLTAMYANIIMTAMYANIVLTAMYANVVLTNPWYPSCVES